MDFRDRVKAAFDAGRVPDEDVVEELAQHAADIYQTARGRGRSDEDALSHVDRHLNAWSSDPAALRRWRRRPPVPAPPTVSSHWFTGLWPDVRYAIRLLGRQPGYTLTAAVTMALGIGATTLVFSVCHAVLMKPLPWPAGDRLVRLSETRRDGTNRLRAIVTNAAYNAWSDRPATLDGLAAWSGRQATLTGAGEPVRVRTAEATASLFSVLGVRPHMGRLFTAAEEDAGATPSAVISAGLWRERFQGTASVLEQILRLDGQSYRIVGVMPASFTFPHRETRVWLPFRVPPTVAGSVSIFEAIGRLRPGVTAEQAAAEGTARARGGGDIGMVGVAVFGSHGPTDIAAEPFLESQTAEVRPAILVLLAAVGLLLVTATANVASLQLARASGRAREIAVRCAIGAGHGTLARQFLVENLMLAVLGGGAGVAMAVLSHRVLWGLLPASFPRVDEIAIDRPVLAVAAAASLVAGMAFGLLPALAARRVSLTGSLAEDALAPVGTSGRSKTARARTVIMTGQVAVACVLLIGAALLARSFSALWASDRGYDPRNVLTALLPLPEPGFTGSSRAALAARLLERLHATPNVSAAAVSTSIPLGTSETLASFTMPSPRGDGSVDAHAAMRYVSPGYFAAMGMRMAEGRGFSERDTATSASVAVVNRAFAMQYLTDSPLRGRLPGVVRDGEEAEVVGVVEDVLQPGTAGGARPEVFVCYEQLPGGLDHDRLSVVVRTSIRPAAFAPTFRALLRQTDSTVAPDEVRTMEERVGASLANPRLYAVLLGTFAASALVIAAVGLFGVLAFTVAQRSREIGVRTALGARPTDIVRLVMRQGFVIAAGGTAIGLVVSLGALRLLSRLLYGVTVYDGWSYAAVIALLVAAAITACAVPAWRAARLDPLRALRS